MSVNVHITHINDTSANITSDLDEYQVAIQTDNNTLGYKPFVYHDGASVLSCANTDKNASFLDVNCNDLTVKEFLNHYGDSNTYFQFQPDQLSLYVGGVNLFDASSASGVLVYHGVDQYSLPYSNSSSKNSWAKSAISTDGTYTGIGVAHNASYILAVGGASYINGALTCTAGVSATTGVFSSTLQCTTLKATSLTDGYVPYHVSDASGLANSPMQTDGSKCWIGASSADFMTISGTSAQYRAIVTGTGNTACGFVMQNALSPDPAYGYLWMYSSTATGTIEGYNRANMCFFLATRVSALMFYTSTAADIVFAPNGTKRLTIASGGGITMAGALTGTSGVFSSTLQCTTIKCTSLTDGYIPYHVSDSSGLANSPIYCTAANIGIGTTTLTAGYMVNISGGNILLSESVNAAIKLQIKNINTGVDATSFIHLENNISSSYFSLDGSNAGTIRANRAAIFTTGAGVILQAAAAAGTIQFSTGTAQYIRAEIDDGVSSLNLFQKYSTYALLVSHADSAHGTTDILPTTARFGILTGLSTGNGAGHTRIIGINCEGENIDRYGLMFEGVVTDAASSIAHVFDGAAGSGTGRAALTAGNIARWTNNSATRMTLDYTGALTCTGEISSTVGLKASTTQYPYMILLTNATGATAGIPYLYLRGNQNSGSGTIAYCDINNAAGSATVANWGVYRDNADDAGAFRFQTRPTGGTLTDRVIITSAGNVGIGTATPQFLFDMYRSISANTAYAGQKIITVPSSGTYGTHNISVMMGCYTSTYSDVAEYRNKFVIQTGGDGSTNPVHIALSAVGATDEIHFYAGNRTGTRMVIAGSGIVTIGSPTNHTAISATGDVSFVGSAGLYPRRIRQDEPPAAGTGATQIDTGEFVMWCDSNDSDKTYIVYNDATKGIVKIALA